MSTEARQRIIVAVGLPGSGKSSWFAEKGIRPLSSDHMRLLLADDEDDQTIHIEVFEAVRFLLRQRLRIGRLDNYVDATNLIRMHRAAYLEIARGHDAQAEALWFDTPLDTCLVRNAARSRQVPEEVMQEMAAAFEPPTVDEGFDRITIIRHAKP